MIDSGQVRSPRYDARSGLTRLHTGPTSRASADQRAGRAGRTDPGVAYRLWSQAEHGHRRPFALAEIEAVDLTALALELALWGTAVAELGFLDPPPARALRDARSLLGELGAIDSEGRVTDQGRAMAELPVHPRLARMIVAAERRGLTSIACALATLVEERDVLRGRPDELPVGVDERVRLVFDRERTHAFADRASLQLVRRRTAELRRRVTGRHDAATDADPTSGDLERCGSVLAVAYPDRLAQSRGDGRYRLRSGAMAVLPKGDALVGDAFLVIADLDAPLGATRPRAGQRPSARPLAGDDDLQIRLAAGLDEADLELAAREAIEEVDALGWDEDRDDLRVRHERRLGSITLATHEARASAGAATTAALVDRVRATRLGVLRWREADRDLQSRAGFARRVFGDDWPDVTDEALLDSIDEWLTPRLTRATGRADLERIDLGQVLRDLVGHHRIRELDALVPVRIEVASGRSIPIDYTGEAPAIAVRVQEVFGTTTHPAVAQGRIPLVVRLLSPAERPIQVTADLPGFWAGSWREVRKDMAGRYPKHDWPVDPTHASPRPPWRGPRSTGSP